MSRTVIDLDDELVADVARALGTRTKKDTDQAARRQLDIAIDWGRYGELLEYDSESGQLVLGTDPAKVGA